MTKRESLLGLAPLESGVKTIGNGSLLPFAPERALTRDEQRTIDESRKEMLVIEADAAKTIFGMAKIAEIHEHGALEFDDTTGYILKIKEQPRGKEHQLYFEEFSKHQIQALARHLMGAIEVGATNIGTEIHRSLYPLPEPAEPRSLRKLLFG